MKTEILCASTGLRQLKAAMAAAVVAHDIVVLPSGLVAVAMDSAEAGAVNLYSHEVECLAVDKTAAQAWTGGQSVYWNDAAKEVTTVASGNTLCGYAVSPAASADVRGQIQLTNNA